MAVLMLLIKESFTFVSGLTNGFAVFDCLIIVISWPIFRVSIAYSIVAIVCQTHLIVVTELRAAEVDTCVALPSRG